jgi:hypothetical protein
MAYLVPWTIYGVVTSSRCPKAWRFDSWPESIRDIGTCGLVLFALADFAFSMWFLFAQPDLKEDASNS